MISPTLKPMRLSHIISTSQFLDTRVLEKIFQVADEMETKEKRGTRDDPLRGKILATLFYEPSTRTRLSFESAMQKLGGSVISTENASQFSSATKGETLEDTIRVIAGYADAIVLRHPEEGTAERASRVSTIPVINAGDGAGEHPTQALLDLYTIKKECGKIEGLTIGLLGDLRYGRTIHSLIPLLALYSPLTLILVSPPSLRLPRSLREILSEKNVSFKETARLDEVIQEVDVLYVTRIQKERFSLQKEYEKVKNSYVVGKGMVSEMKQDARILHPLPRVNEIDQEIDSDPRAAYFRQAKNGLFVRMALLTLILR